MITVTAWQPIAAALFDYTLPALAVAYFMN